MKILNLYAGIGGNRKLWGDEHEITAVEYDENIAAVYRDYFPNDIVIVADAHQYLLDHYKEFDFIWSSPPCQTHSRINKNFNYVRFPDFKLYEEIVFLDNFFNGKYCVENVIPYYQKEMNSPLIPAQRNGRHLFWCNFRIQTTGKENPEKEITMVAQKTKRRGVKKNNMKFKKNRNHKDNKFERNAVDPNLGLMILNAAQNIITKQNEKQINLFE